jgi:YVTN family beta-propeller protein
VIATATNTVAATIAVGSGVGGIAVAPDGKHAYVTGAAGNIGGAVSVIDTATNTVTATLAVGFGPSGAVAVTPDGKHAYVANSVFNNFSVIDTATWRAIPVGSPSRRMGNAPISRS